MQTNKAFILRNIYGKHILMPICNNSASNNPILLNDMAVSVWQAASSNIDREGILDEISHSYELARCSAEMESVNNFILVMIDMGLLSE